MQVNTLKLKKRRPKKKTIGRGGKKGTYSGKGNKGQKARSGASINPLFEGGRSTLVDHLKKLRGFKTIKPKKNIVKLTDLEKKFKKDAIINKESLVEAGLVEKRKSAYGIKILGNGSLTLALTIEPGIFLSDSARKAITKAGGKIAEEPKKKSEK